MAAIYRPIVETTAISFELEAPTESEFVERLLRVQSRDPWLVAQAGAGEDGSGEILGYAYASDFRARAAYGATRETTVYVSTDHHGRGVGRALLEELLAILESRGVRVAIAGIALPNDASIALHQRLGFQLVGTFNEVGHKFGAWHDLSFWQRSLGPEAGPTRD